MLSLTIDTMLGAPTFPLMAFLRTEVAYLFVLAELGDMAKSLALEASHGRGNVRGHPDIHVTDFDGLWKRSHSEGQY